MVSLLVALAAAVTVGLVVPPGDTGDLAFFMHSAERLFSGGWAQTYADPALQVGPLQLVVLGTLDTVAGLAGISSTRLIGAVFGAVATGPGGEVVLHRSKQGSSAPALVQTVDVTPAGGGAIEAGPAVDLGSFDRSTWVNQTGASGHAFDGHYDDQVEDWVAGRQQPWAFTEKAVREAADDELTLVPGG